MKLVFAAALACACAATPALAAPGLGDEVYGATMEKGETEAEAKFDTLTGGPASGEDVMKFELSHTFTDNLTVAVHAEFAQDAGAPRRAEEAGIEAIYHLGRAGGIDFALYGEYAVGFHGPDALEAKLLMQHRSGPWDLRLNLIAEKSLQSGEPVEFGYAASADTRVAKGVRLGAQAFGELGSTHKFLPDAEHFVGPVAKFRVATGDRDGDDDGDEGIGLEVGYLFPLGKAKDDTNGQFRVALEFEF
jgi:hypothetical protein